MPSVVVVVVAVVKGENAFCLDLLHPFFSEEIPIKIKLQKALYEPMKTVVIYFWRALFLTASLRFVAISP